MIEVKIGILMDLLWAYVLISMKYISVLVIVLILYLGYRFYFIPSRIKSHYRKHSIPVRQRNNTYSKIKKSALNSIENSRDMNLSFNHTWHTIEICSIEAIKDFTQKIPQYFDRSSHLSNLTHKLFKLSISNNLRNDETKHK